MIKVNGLEALAKRLGRLNLAATKRAALEHAAVTLRDDVRQRLSRTPGESHDAPWLRSGALRESITHEVNGTEAVVGSVDPVATFQECGTSTDPPRPFLAPAATGAAELLAASIAAEVVGRLRTVFT